MIKDEIADQLVYSTVKITCRNSTAVSTGTGFFMRKDLQNGSNINAIVTNKHVVNGFARKRKLRLCFETPVIPAMMADS